MDSTLVSYDNKSPALLPYGHHLSTLIVRYTYNICDSGVATTVAKVRVKYWIIKAHKIAKVIKQRCFKCRRMEAKAETQLMAVLPPMSTTAVHTAFLVHVNGLLWTHQSKSWQKKTVKHYGVIFNFLNTRAIHFELAVDATAMKLLQVLRRFFSYRGYTKFRLSDNSTQMVGADSELKLMIEGWNERVLRRPSN